MKTHHINLNFSRYSRIIEKDQVSRLRKKKNKKPQQVCIFARGQLFLKSTFAMRNKSFVSQVSMSRVILLSSNFSFIQKKLRFQFLRVYELLLYQQYLMQPSQNRSGKLVPIFPMLQNLILTIFAFQQPITLHKM